MSLFNDGMHEQRMDKKEAAIEKLEKLLEEAETEDARMVFQNILNIVRSMT